MADYNVGGISLDFKLKNQTDVSKQLDDLAKGLKGVRKALQGFGDFKQQSIDELANGISTLSKIDFKGVVDNFAKLGSAEVSTNIQSVANSFNILYKSVKQIAEIQFEEFANNLTSVANADFSKITENLSNLNNLEPKNLTAFTSVIRNINKLGEDSVPFDRIKDHFQQLAEAIDPFLEKLKSVQPALEQFSNSLDLGKISSDLSVAKARIDEINARAQRREVLDGVKLEKANVQLKITEQRLENIKNKSKKASVNFNTLFNIGKIYFLFNYTKRLGQSFGRIISSAIDFEETLNKFQVSFGNYTNEATKFANKLTNAFNLSRESVMNYMSTFNNMLKGLGGISEQSALGLSQTLTQMAIDYASLMNTSITTAMQQFQSVLAGQTKAIRTTSGVDVTDNTIMQIYQAMGGTKTQRQLSQTEKRLLRILAVQKQLSELGAFGINEETGEFLSDFEKTLNSASNNLKRISETFKEWSVYLGNLLLHYFEPIIQKALSFMIVLKEITKSFVELKGIATREYANNIASIFNEASDSVDELNNKLGLLGFDRFESLNKSSGEDNSSVDLIVSQIKEYEDIFDKVENRASKVANSILESFGYTKELNEETGDYTYKLGEGTEKLQSLKETLGLIAGIIGTIISMVVTLKITQKISSVAETLGKIADLSGGLKASLGVVGLIVGAIAYGYATNEDFRESINNLVKTLMPIVKQVLVSLKEIFNNIIQPIFSLVAKIINSLMPTIIPIIDTIKIALSTIFSVIKDITDVFSFIVNLASFVLAPAIKVITVSVGFILSILNTILVVVSAIVETIAKLFTFHWGEIGGVWSSVGEKIQNVWSNFAPQTFASGGLPTKGQMFIANESGAELVGNIGGRTAVANNDMIVQAIEQASYKGIVKGMSVSSQKQDINIDLRGFSADEVARAIYTPLINEFKRNGITLKGA